MYTVKICLNSVSGGLINFNLGADIRTTRDAGGPDVSIATPVE